MRQHALRLCVSIAGVVAVTWIGHALVPVNALTVGFAYMLLVLLIASTWGFVEAFVASCAATLAFNYFFLPPIGTLTIADPQNWVALFAFLGSSLIASRLSARAEARAGEAIEREQDVERLYSFSRAILLIDAAEPAFPKQLAARLAEIFAFRAAVLYDRRSDTFYRAGPSDFEGMDDRLRECARTGTTFADAERNHVIAAIRLGAEPIASLALQGGRISEALLQGIASLLAIGMERARAQEMAHQIEAARQSDLLRTTLIDAMAHEFKTPLTSIRAATSALLSLPDQPPDSRMELLRVADEEADHLQHLIDDAVEMARLDSAQIAVALEYANVFELAQEAAAALRTQSDQRNITMAGDPEHARLPLDRRLVSLALRQLLDNALKYSPPDSDVELRVVRGDDEIRVEITDHGGGISPAEQARIFERFYRSPQIRRQVPGSGLGLNIAQSIMRAHKGDLTVTSGPGETTFRMIFPVARKEAVA